MWETYYYHGSMQLRDGLVQQMYGLHKCNEMRKQYERESGVRYEYMMRLRPDNMVLEQHPSMSQLDFGDARSPKILFPTRAKCSGGNEDFYGVGRTDVMDTYFDRVLLIGQTAPASDFDIQRMTSQKLPVRFMSNSFISFLSIHLSIYLYLSIYLSISICRSTYSLPTYLSVYQKRCK